MRAREYRLMIRELLDEERVLTQTLSRVRATLEYLTDRARKADLAEGTALIQPPPLGNSESVSPIDAPPPSPTAPNAGDASRMTLADWIDRVLTPEPMTAASIAERIRSTPGSPGEILEATVRWNLSNKSAARGWVRGGSRAHALWSKQPSPPVSPP